MSFDPLAKKKKKKGDFIFEDDPEDHPVHEEYTEEEDVKE